MTARRTPERTPATTAPGRLPERCGDDYDAAVDVVMRMLAWLAVVAMTVGVCAQLGAASWMLWAAAGAILIVGLLHHRRVRGRTNRREP